MLRRTLTLAALTAALPLALAATPAPPSAATGGAIVDAAEQQDCTQLYPQRYSVSGITDEGQTVVLDVRVLIDVADAQDIALALEHASTDEERAAAQARFDALVADTAPRIAAAQESYGPLDVEVAYTYELLTPYDRDGTVRDRGSDAQRNSQGLIDLAKHQYGGARPADVDVVYVITDRDLYADGIGDAVAGQADCIGGVAWADTAFAVGELFPAIPIGPIEFYREGTAKIVAHEIGHLMGAHHHYQDCGYHAVPEAQRGGFGACSLMTNAVDFQTTQLSVLSGAVVRAHAVDFADR